MAVVALALNLGMVALLLTCNGVLFLSGVFEGDELGLVCVLVLVDLVRDVLGFDVGRVRILDLD